MRLLNLSGPTLVSQMVLDQQPKYSIPFNRPTIVGKELYYISQAILEGHSSGDGRFSRQCHKLLEEALGAPRVLLTTSCTHALELAALLIDIKPGDEVIIPSFTFVSTVNAFVLRGARPVFIDIRPDTLNLDEAQLERLITPRTRAIVPVHYAGIGCEMDAILEIAGRYGVQVIEDNAHGLFGKYRGKFLGTFGSLATQSFHETKNFTCGEGGALVINDPALIDRAEILREKGTNRSRFFRGQVDKYTWVDIGSSYLPCGYPRGFSLCTAGSPGTNPGQTAADLGRILQYIGAMVRRKWRAPAGHTGTLRAVVPHVLSASAITRSTPGADRAPQTIRDTQRFSLPASAPVRDGRSLRR